MLYPETSPTAPVSRDDLAAIIGNAAMQQQAADMPQGGLPFRFGRRLRILQRLTVHGR